MGFWNSGGTQTTTQTSTPWGPAQDALKLGLKDATKAYKDGVGGGIYTGNTYVDPSRQTTAARSGLSALARQQATGGGLVREAKDIMNQGGFNDQQLAAMKGLTTAGARNDALYKSLGSNGLTSTQDGALAGLMGGRADLSALMKSMGANGLTSDQDIALKNYRDTATSKFRYSPDFQAVLDASLQDAREGVNANAASAGRYGSGVAQGVMADKLGRISNEARLGEYRDWQGRKDAANSNLANLAQVGVGNRTNGLQLGQGFDSAIAGLGQTGLGNLSSLIQSGEGINSALFNAGQAGLGNMKDAYGVAQLPYQTQMQIGAMDEDLATRKLNDKIRLFEAKQNAPWNQISRLNAVASGAGQMGSTQTSSQPGQNPFLTALGYGTTGLGLLGGLF